MCAFGRSVCLAFFCRSIKCSGLAVRLDPHPLPTPIPHSPRGHSRHSNHPHHRSTTTLDMRHQRAVSLGVLGCVSQVLKEASLFCSIESLGDFSFITSVCVCVCVCVHELDSSICEGPCLAVFPIACTTGRFVPFPGCCKAAS